MKFSRPLVWVFFVVLTGLWAPLGASPATPESKTPEEDPLPVVVSPTQTWQFNGSLEKVRDALVTLLKEDGLSIKEENRAAGTFATDLIIFDDKKFGVDVSVPPPRANPKYPWLQAIAVSSGRFGLEGKLTGAGPDLTRLDLRAIIEVTAMNTKKGGQAWIPRYSNGTVEHLYISRLGLKLLPTPPSESTPR